MKLPFDVRHSAEDLATLAEQLKSIEGETQVVMEHTGRYYEVIAKVLHDAGLYISAVNPLLIKEYGNKSLRKVKTDKADVMKIAIYAFDNWPPSRKPLPQTTSSHCSSSPSLAFANSLTVLCAATAHRSGWISLMTSSMLIFRG